MKIAIDISQIVYEGTGVARYTRELVRHLVRIDTQNQYVLFAGTWRKKSTVEDYAREFHGMKHVHIKILPIPQIIGTFLWNSLHVIPVEQFIGSIDLLHSSDWIQPPTRAKRVTTLHDFVVLKFPETSHKRIVSNQLKRLQWVKKECDAVIADSQATSNDAAQYLHIPKEKLFTAYPGIDPMYQSATEKDKARVRQTYNLWGDYILALGTMEPRKNLKRLLWAYLQVKENHRTSAKIPQLVLVGKQGWGKRMQTGAGAKILGYVPDTDLPALYAAAKLFVYPSLYEGFGFPVLEAMAAGCPVVTSEGGSLKEVAGDAAILIDPENVEDISAQIQRITIDTQLRSELIQKGKQQAARFTWERTAATVLDVYETLFRRA